MIITWYGTASVSIETEYGKILFDPFLPLQESTGTGLPDFRGFRHVVITHAHPDHIGNLPELYEEEEREIYGTQAATGALTEMGIPSDRLHTVSPGDGLSFGDITVRVYKGRHIRYDAGFLLRTFFSLRMIRYRKNLWLLGKMNRICKERGETVGYLIEAEGKRIFLLGSLGLDSDTDYPEGADLLILPYQGASDLLTPALEVVRRLKPKAVLLDHFDDTFPPLSADIDPGELEKALTGKITLVIPERKKRIEL